jgi:hypothetical protein
MCGEGCVGTQQTRIRSVSLPAGDAILTMYASPSIHKQAPSPPGHMSGFQLVHSLLQQRGGGAQHALVAVPQLPAGPHRGAQQADLHKGTELAVRRVGGVRPRRLLHALARRRIQVPALAPAAAAARCGCCRGCPFQRPFCLLAAVLWTAQRAAGARLSCWAGLRGCCPGCTLCVGALPSQALLQAFSQQAACGREQRRVRLAAQRGQRPQQRDERLGGQLCKAAVPAHQRRRHRIHARRARRAVQPGSRPQQQHLLARGRASDPRAPVALLRWRRQLDLLLKPGTLCVAAGLPRIVLPPPPTEVPLQGVLQQGQAVPWRQQAGRSQRPSQLGDSRRGVVGCAPAARRLLQAAQHPLGRAASQHVRAAGCGGQGCG